MWRKEYNRFRKYYSDIVSLYQQKQSFQTFLEIFLSLTTIIAFTLLALRPTVLTISQLLTEIREKEGLVSQMDEKISALQQAQGILVQESVNLARLNTAIPDSPTPETYIRQAEGVAKANNVQILGLSAGEATFLGQTQEKRKSSEEALPGGAEGIAVSTSVSGDYPSLASFLSSLENLLRPIFVDNLSISSTEETIVLVIGGQIPFLR
jgi:hypothetical protein